MATGGKTLKKSGSDGSGFLYLESLGHHIIDLVPGLIGLKGKQSFFADIAGIRADVKVDLYIESTHVCSEQGELQLTNYAAFRYFSFQELPQERYQNRKKSMRHLILCHYGRKNSA